MAFLNEKNEFNYEEFFKAISPIPFKPIIEFESLLERIRNSLINQKQVLRPYFQKFDHLQSGEIPLSHFLGVLRDFGIQFNEDETIVLQKNLAPQKNSAVHYLHFCDQVDPSLPPPQPRVYPDTPKKDKNEIASTALEVMTRVAAASLKYGFDIESNFRKFDNSFEGQISINDFRSVLQSMPVTFSEQELDFTSEFYLNSFTSKVNYVHFCKDMAEFGGKRVNQNPQKALESISQSLPLDIDLEPILKKIVLILCSKNIPPESLFLPYDQRSSGQILQSKLIAVFDGTGLNLSPKEIAIIGVNFQDQRVPERFNYKEFCQVLKSVSFSDEELSSLSVESNEMKKDESIIELCTLIREKLNARHKNVRIPFSKFKSQIIPSTDFRKCVESFGLIIKENDMQKLIRAYKRNAKGDVDWNEFCNEVEKSKTIR